MKKKTIWIGAGALAAVLAVGGVGVAIAEPFDNDDNDRLTGSVLDDASAAALAEVGEGEVTGAEKSDDADHAYEVEVTLPNGTDVDVDLDESFAVVRVDDDDRRSDDGSSDDRGTGASGSTADDATSNGGSSAISDSERADAEAAALAEVGTGRITALERSDDRDHAWEVEVTRDDGTEIDVELDADFAVTRVDQ